MSKKTKDSPQVFVGIGASAGGLKALQQLLPNLPVGRGYTYVVIQHMDPTQPSILDQILKKHTTLTVKQAVDGTVLLPDHLYITPSDKDSTVINGSLLLEDVHDNGPRHSVDALLRSLAVTHGNAAVGIILAGTRIDGLQGAHELKAVEGLVLAQDPKDAEHTSMPQAIVSANLADIIASAANLGTELAQIIDRGNMDPLLDTKAFGADARALLIEI